MRLNGAAPGRTSRTKGASGTDGSGSLIGARVSALALASFVNDEENDLNPVPVPDANPSVNALPDEDGWDDSVLAAPSSSPAPIPVPPPPPLGDAAPQLPPQTTSGGRMPEDFLAFSPPLSSTRLAAATPWESPAAPLFPTPLPMVRADGALRDDSVNLDHLRPVVDSGPPTTPILDDGSPSGTDPWIRLERWVDDTRPLSHDEVMRRRDAQVLVANEATGRDTLPLGALVPPPLASPMPPPLVSPLPPPLVSPLPPPWQSELASSSVDPRQGRPQQQQGYVPIVPRAPRAMRGGPFPPSAPPAAMASPPQRAPASGGQGRIEAARMGESARALMTAPSPPPDTRPRLTPQIIVLVGAGLVCLAIFVIGFVLLVTTRLS